MKIDIWLASHAAQFRMHEKYKPGDVFNPARFVDPAGFLAAVQELEKTYVHVDVGVVRRRFERHAAGDRRRSDVHGRDRRAKP